MKKLLLVITAVLLMVGSAWALADNINDNDNKNTNTAVSSSSARAENDVRNTNAQGQLQGQLQGQGQVANGQVNVGGDETKVKSYAVSYPALSGGEGVSQANAYSIFGGLGLSNTEKYKIYITQIQAVEASTTLPAETKAKYVDMLAAKMVLSNKTQRLLGIGPEMSGRNLLNLFGILTWDSFWKEGQKPFQRQKDMGK